VVLQHLQSALPEQIKAALHLLISQVCDVTLNPVVATTKFNKKKILSIRLITKTNLG